MRRSALVSFGLLAIGLLGCSDAYGPSAHVLPTEVEVSANPLFPGGAEISLEKSTNGQDADEAPGPSVEAGTPVVWEYVVTNTGNEDLTGVTVTDDTETDFFCFVGDLPVGQSHVCSFEKIAEAGPYANLGVAQGTSTGGGTFGMSLPTWVEATDWSHYTGEEPQSLPPTESVEVVIKPGDGAPCLNAFSKGRLPIAILGSEDFDALSVDPETVLAGETVLPVRWGKGEDVNGDGYDDLVLHFLTQELNAAGLLVDGAELVITGLTFDEGGFSGFDVVRLAGEDSCKG